MCMYILCVYLFHTHTCIHTRTTYIYIYIHTHAHTLYTASCYARAYILVDITHDATRATTFDPISTNPDKYLHILHTLSHTSGVRLLTHEGADNGAGM